MIAKTMKAGDTGTVLIGEMNPFLRSHAAVPAKPVLVRERTRKAPGPDNWLLAQTTGPYIREIEPAIYCSEAWLSTAVFVQNRMMEMCEDLCSVEPAWGVPYALSRHLFAQWVAGSVQLFGMWIPKAPCKPAPIVREMVEMEEEALKEAIEVEEETLCQCMDIATGAGAEWERRCVPRSRARHSAA